MSTRAARSLAALLGWALLVPASAAAQPAQRTPAPPPQPGAAPAATPSAAVSEEEEEDPDEGLRRRGAPDTRQWHWLLDAKGGFIAPTGSFGPGVRAGSLVSAGPIVGGSLGLGVSRQVVVEGSGAFEMLGSGSRCSECSGKGYQIGLGLTYHAAQGLAFDPWMSFGVAYRSLTVDGGGQKLPIEAGGGQSGTFRGLDVARLALGGSFFPIPSLGFGPYLGVDLGTFLQRPDAPVASEDEGAHVYAMFHVGARISFDPVRAIRGEPAAAPRPTAAGARRVAVANPQITSPGTPQHAARRSSR